MLKQVLIIFLLSISYSSFSQCTGSEPVLFLGNDTTLCPGNSLVLTAPNGYQYYNWSDSTHNHSITVNTAGNYSVEVGIVEPTNLVVNGTFESGNTGFTTGYTLGVGGAYGPLTNPGTYGISTSPNLLHNLFSSCADHTPAGPGRMLIVNGAGTPNSLVWSETVTVTSNTDYQFGTWAMSALTETNVALLQFQINGVPVGSVFSPSQTGCAWLQFTSSWNSGASTSAVLSIVNQNTVNTGNDFALDDITFNPLCKHTDNINVMISPLPTQTTALVNPSNCSGTPNGSITITCVTGTQYSFDGGTTWQTSNVKSNLAAGTYTVMSKNAAGCTVSTSVTLTNASVPPTQTTTLVAPTTCTGTPDGSITITCATATQYSFDGGTTWVASNVKTGLAAGAYTVMSQNASGCTVTSSVTLANAATAPTQTTTLVSPTNCTGTPNGSITINCASATQFSFDGGTTWGATNISTGLAAGNYTVMSQDASGCSVTSVITLTSSVAVPTQSTTSVPPTNCTGSPNGSITITCATATQYSFDAGVTWIPSNVQTGLAAGTYTVMSQNAAGCTASTSVNLVSATSAPVQTTSFVSPTPCVAVPDGSITITCATATQYSFDAGTTWLPSNTQTGLAAGTYTVMSQDALGCTSSSIVTIPGSVAVAPTIMVSPDTTICQNGTATIGAIGFGGTSYTYHWTGLAGTGPVQTVSPSTTGYYVVQVENQTGCLSAKDSILVTVLQPLSGIASPPVTVCPNQIANLSVSNMAGGLPPYSMVWTNGATVIGTGSSINVTVSSPTNYSVLITDACQSTALILTTSVGVNTLTIPMFKVDDSTQCEPAVFTLSNMMDPTQVASSVWEISNGVQFTNQNQITLNQYAAGHYGITLIVTSIAGCVDTLSVANALTVYPEPIANFTYSPTHIQMFNTTVDFTNQSTGAVDYIWRIQGGSPSSSTLENVISKLPEGDTGTYTVMLVAISDHQCADSILQVLTVYPEQIFYAPNAFTPNGDGNNPTWRVYMAGYDFRNFDLNVFDRWGELIWNTNDVNAEWDGTCKGNVVEDGVYSWSLVTKDIGTDKKFYYNGHITLIK